MKNLFLLLLLCTFLSPSFSANRIPLETESQQSDTPSWIYSLNFTNRKMVDGCASGEMYFPEAATVTFFFAAPTSGTYKDAGFNYRISYRTGNGGYYLKATDSDIYVTYDVPKGSTVKIEIRRSPGAGGTARATTTEVNGYYWRPYPIVF